MSILLGGSDVNPYKAKHLNIKDRFIYAHKNHLCFDFFKTKIISENEFDVAIYIFVKDEELQLLNCDEAILIMLKPNGKVGEEETIYNVEWSNIEETPFFECEYSNHSYKVKKARIKYGKKSNASSVFFRAGGRKILPRL